MKKVGEFVILILGTCFTAFVTFPFTAWGLSFIWNWHLVTYLGPAPSIWAISGIQLFFGVLLWRYNANDAEAAQARSFQEVMIHLVNMNISYVFVSWVSVLIAWAYAVLAN